MMEDLAALNRRTQLPMRIIQDRPHQQKGETLWEDIQENQDGYAGEKKTYTIENHSKDEIQEIKQETDGQEE